MGTTARVFIVNNDDSLRRIPLARYTRLYNHDPGESIPEYAGKRVRCVMVILEVDRRIPLEILHVDYFFLPFDTGGRFDTAEEVRERESVGEMMETFYDVPGTGNVIPARAYFAKRRYEIKYKWTPTPEIESAIVDAIFGAHLP